MINKKKSKGGFIAVPETAIRVKKENFSKIFSPGFTENCQGFEAGIDKPACHIIKADMGPVDGEPCTGSRTNFSIVLPVMILKGE